MAAAITVCAALALLCAIAAWRHKARPNRDEARTTPREPARCAVAPPVSPAKPAAPRPTVSGEDVANTIGGWLLGHETAHGHTGFPGDPLPGGHLGSASDLAFWGGILDDDPDDPDF